MPAICIRRPPPDQTRPDAVPPARAARCRLGQETHEVARRKVEQMDKLRAAFGLSAEAKEGEAFDQELQEQKRQERIAEREAKEKERR